MPQGLQIFNPSGGIVLDVTDSLTRTLGEVIVKSGQSGSIVNPELEKGTPWYTVIPLTVVSKVDDARIQMDSVLCVFSADTMTWQWIVNQIRTDVKIIYGVF